MIAYSSQAKNELDRLTPGSRCCQKAELLGFVHSEGKLIVRPSGPVLDVACSNAAGSRKVYRLLRLLYPEMKIELIRPGRVGKRNHYSVRISEPARVNDLLDDLGIEAGDLSRKDIDLVKRESALSLLRQKCCKTAYVRGLFIMRGYVTNPERGYHLEFVFDKPEVAPVLSGVLKDLGIRNGIAQRNRYSVVYVKGADDIGRLLSLTGAHSAVLDLENVRIVKDMRNDVNRLVNCETANVDKTVRASVRQLEDIQLIDERRGIQNLPVRLRSVAYARLDHPYASLDELARLMSPRLTKSGINHRMRQLSRIARALREEENGGNQEKPGEKPGDRDMYGGLHP